MSAKTSIQWTDTSWNPVRGWPDVIDIEDRVEHDLDGTRDGYQGAPVRIHLKDRKGGSPEEWPADLRIREFPQVTV
jgi:hypothetical protein